LLMLIPYRMMVRQLAKYRSIAAAPPETCFGGAASL
jgi:hypothetical protein